MSTKLSPSEAFCLLSRRGSALCKIDLIDLSVSRSFNARALFFFLFPFSVSTSRSIPSITRDNIGKHKIKKEREVDNIIKIFSFCGCVNFYRRLRIFDFELMEFISSTSAPRLYHIRNTLIHCGDLKFSKRLRQTFGLPLSVIIIPVNLL